MNYAARVAAQLRGAPLRGQSPMAGLDRRNLGPLQVFAQSVSNTAPAAGMAVIPAIVAANAGTSTIWSVAVATGLALLVASCIGRFTRRMAAAGSLYSLTAKGLGPGSALLCGGGLLVGYLMLTMASLVGAAIQLRDLVGSPSLPAGPRTAILAGALLLVSAVVALCAVRGVRLAASVVLLAESVSIGLMLVVFGALLARHTSVPGAGLVAALDTAQLPGHIDVGAVAAGALPALGAFIGFESAAALGVEARRPFRSVPRAVRRTAILTGMLSLVAAYTQVASFARMPGGLAAQSSPVPELAAAEGSPWLSVVLGAGLATSFFACALATSTALARLLLSAGREGVLPRWLGATHPRRRTPHLAIAAMVPVVTLLPVAVVAAGVAANRLLVTLLTTAAIGYLIAYLLVCLAAPVFLYRIGELTVPSVLVTALIVPVLLVVLCAFVVVTPGWVAPVVASVVLVASAARYLVLRWRQPERVAAIGLYDETSVADLFGALAWRRR